MDIQSNAIDYIQKNKFSKDFFIYFIHFSSKFVHKQKTSVFIYFSSLLILNCRGSLDHFEI